MPFSGGGLRAATLVASVLDQLNDEGLADKIAVISSTSSGSVAAGYFAAKSMEGMEGMNPFQSKPSAYGCHLYRGGFRYIGHITSLLLQKLNGSLSINIRD